MATPFVVTTFVVLTTLNNAGQLAPVDKAELPAGSAGPIAWNEQQCIMLRGKMSHPEKYFCQVFTSAKTTKWTYPPPDAIEPTSEPEAAPPEHSSNPSNAFADVQVGPTELQARDQPTPLPPMPQAPKQVAKRTAPSGYRAAPSQQVMLDGNPFSGFVSLVTGNW